MVLPAPAGPATWQCLRLGSVEPHIPLVKAPPQRDGDQLQYLAQAAAPPQLRISYAELLQGQKRAAGSFVGRSMLSVNSA